MLYRVKPHAARPLLLSDLDATHKEPRRGLEDDDYSGDVLDPLPAFKVRGFSS
jgi:hypothetical protein